MSFTIFKAKKFLASKFSETQAGRTMILKLFGHHGDHIMSAMKEIAETYADQATAKQLRLDIMKLLLKLVLLYREGIITEHQAEPAKQPLLLMMDLLIETLEMPPSKRDARALSMAMRATHDAVMPLIQPNIREHNWRRLTRVFEFYGDHNFLETFLTADEYALPRDSILVNLRVLLRPYESKMTETKEFMRAQTAARRAHVAALVQNPAVNQWLGDDQATSLFSEFLRQNFGPDINNLLLFLKGLKHFKSTNNRNLLATRASQVYDRFLSEQATSPIEVSAGARDAVQSSFEESHSGVTRSMFDPAAVEATNRLEEVFNSMFMQSEQFHVLVEELAQFDSKIARHDHLKEVLKNSGPEGDITDIQVEEVSKEGMENSEDEEEHAEAGAEGAAEERFPAPRGTASGSAGLSAAGDESSSPPPPPPSEGDAPPPPPEPAS